MWKILPLLLACSPAQRSASLAATSTILLAWDWEQTHGITAGCNESNPVLGPCGRRFPVDVYFPLVIGANLAAGLLLPQWRDALWAGMAGVEGATVLDNLR